MISTTTQPQNPNANSCWQSESESVHKKLEPIAPVYFKLSHKW